MPRTRRPDDRFLHIMQMFSEFDICVLRVPKASLARRLRRDIYYMMGYVRKDPTAEAWLLNAISSCEVAVKLRKGEEFDDPNDPPANVVIQRKNDLLAMAAANVLPPEEAKRLYWSQAEREQREKEGKALRSFSPSPLKPAEEVRAEAIRRICEKYNVETEDDLHFLLPDARIEREVDAEMRAQASRSAGRGIGLGSGASAGASAGAVQDAASATIRRLFSPPSSPSPSPFPSKED